MLDLSAIEAGHLSIEMEALPLAPLIKECQVLISPQALGRQVVLNTSYSGHCAVRGDRKRLKQVLLNLLSNGIKYNCEGGQLTLSVIEHEATIRLTVTDTGQGIPPDLTNRVFQPFDRLGASNVEGTGIGLSITRRLVELMGGHIGFDSTLGVGTTFWVELDKAPSESCAPASLLSAASNASPTDSEAIPNTTMRDTVTYHILAIALSPAENELLRLIVSTLRGACLTLLTSLEEASEVISRQPCLAIIADAVLINTFLATMPQQGQDTPVLIALNDQDGAPPGVDPRIHHEQVKPLKTREIARILREAMP